MPDWKGTVQKSIAGLNLESARESTIVEEISAHLEDRYQELLANGTSKEEAYRQTLEEMGDSALLGQELSDVERQGGPDPTPRTTRRIHIFTHDFWKDVRYGLRGLYKAPVFAAAAIITLALAVGANTAVFSVVDSLIFRPLPVKDANRLAVLAFRQGDGPLLIPFSIADFRDIRDQTKDVFSDVLGYQIGIDGLSANGKTDRVVSGYVSGNYFSMLGVKPQLGRLILPSEGQSPGSDPVLVLSYSYWKARFGGDPKILGRDVLINGHPVTVVGVANRGFYGLERFSGEQIFMPLGMLSLEAFPRDFMTNRILQNLSVVASVKPQMKLPAVTAVLSDIAAHLSAEYPDTDKNMKLSVYWERYARPDPLSAGVLIKASAMFFVLVALVLLLACANVANLLLVRATLRRREMAIRMALGAGPIRLIRQLLAESMLLAFLGGAAGLLLGIWASSAAGSIGVQTNLPLRIDLEFSWRLFFYIFGAVLAIGILIGLLPALQASKSQISATLHQSGRSVTTGGHRIRSALVVVQLAGALMLLITAGLFIKSLIRVEQTDLGFDPDNIVNMTMDPVQIGYNESQGLKFYRDLLAQVQNLPGIDSAALTSSVPLSDQSNNDYLRVSDYQSPAGQGPPLVYYSVVSPDYLRTLRIPLVHGRQFTDGDVKGSPYVAIVNEAFARHFWSGEDPIGKHFAKVSGITNPTYEVVGVVKDSRCLVMTGPISPHFYLPLAQNYSLASEETLQVRSALPSESVIRMVTETRQNIQPELALYGIRTMVEALDTLQGLFLFRFGAAAATILGGIGLILSVIGVYGVISYSLSQRTREIGVRVALGAERHDILRLILVRGIVIIALGTGLGLIAAFGVSRLAAGLLAGVSPVDPMTYLSISSFLAIVALAACYLPARRAAAVDPVVALRQD